MMNWLIDLRKTKGMTHEDVSNACGISRQYYSMIEMGERSPSVETAKKIAKVLDFDYGLNSMMRRCNYDIKSMCYI